ncbi:MAG: protein phosphatase 2C family protein, partial [Nannocystaceae bacterium]|nr:protein phosphatase 2C family protein [Nannocystaceae bacterium]
MQDNSAHGEDSFLTKDLGSNEFLDVVLDGVTGHGGEQASTELRDALDAGTLNNSEDIVSLLTEMNADFFSVGSGRFLLTTVSAVLGRGETIQIVSAGDSPVFLINKDGHKKLSGNAGGLLHVGVARAIGASEPLGAPAVVE